MSESAISVQGLGKCYRLGSQARLDQTIPEAISATVQGAVDLVRRSKGRRKRVDKQDFWALRDVSFDVHDGEVIGVIGRNGAGKSTLLKILSQITDPTEGCATVHGRVASLLEVGTGFHPELTGRENIYLNGSILGMSRREIKTKFDQIVAFSGVEQFLDTPIKRYSSGMTVRLAFAVAAHLDPEILIVDEVLAVGDTAFQKKCLGKMGDIAQSGRTVLFVSHNMAAVKHLCQTGIVLDQGRLIYQGTSAESVQTYLKTIRETIPQGVFAANRENWDTSSDISLIDMRIKTNDPTSVPRTGEPMSIELLVDVSKPLIEPAVTIDFRSEDDMVVFRACSILSPEFQADTVFGRQRICLDIDRVLLGSGQYQLDVRVHQPRVEVLLDIPAAAGVMIAPGDFYGQGITFAQRESLVVMNHQWKLEPAKHRRLESAA